MTWTLIRKDVRLLRPLMLSAAVIGVVFYVLIPAAHFIQWRQETLKWLNPAAYQEQREELYEDVKIHIIATDVESGATLMWFFDLLLVTTACGMAFAVERRERWADFAAMLPASRGRAIRAKMILTLTAVVALPAANGVIAVTSHCLRRYSWQTVYWSGELPSTIFFYSAAVLGMTGAAWLLSSLSRSPVLATTVAIGVVGMFFFMFADLYATRNPDRVTVDSRQWVAGAVLAGGLCCWAAGTIVQLRRTSP